MAAPDKLSIIVFSGSYQKVHYALATAAAAAAIDRPATLFFTMDACHALAAGDGWHRLDTEHDELAAVDIDNRYRDRGVADFETLLLSCKELGVNFLICEMGLRAIEMASGDLRTDIPITEGGLVTFLNDASATGAMLFI